MSSLGRPRPKSLFGLCLNLVTSNDFIENYGNFKDVPLPVFNDMLNNVSALGLSMLEDVAENRGVDSDYFWEKHYRRLSPFCTQKWQFLNLNLKPESSGFHKKLYFQTLCLRLVTLLNMEGLVYGTARESWQEFVLQMLTSIPEVGKPCLASICQESKPNVSLVPRCLSLIASNVSKIIFCPSSLTRIKNEIKDFACLLRSIKRVEALGVKDTTSKMLLSEFLASHMHNVNELQFRFCRFERRKPFIHLLSTIRKKGNGEGDSDRVTMASYDNSESLHLAVDGQQYTVLDALVLAGVSDDNSHVFEETNRCHESDSKVALEADLYDAAFSRDDPQFRVVEQPTLDKTCPKCEEVPSSLSHTSVNENIKKSPLIRQKRTTVFSPQIHSIEFITCSFSQEVFMTLCSELVLLKGLEKLVVTGLLFNILPLCKALNKLETSGGKLKHLKLQDCFIDRVSLELICMICQPYSNGAKLSSYLRSLSLVGCDLESSSMAVICQCITNSVAGGKADTTITDSWPDVSCAKLFEKVTNCQDGCNIHAPLQGLSSFSAPGMGSFGCCSTKRDMFPSIDVSVPSKETDNLEETFTVLTRETKPCSSQHVTTVSTFELRADYEGLRDLNLAQNCVKDCGISSLSQAVKKNRSLEALNISHTEASWTGLNEILTSLTDHQRLRKLILSGNIFDGSTVALSNLILRNQLVYLDLSCCCLEGFTDDFLDALKSNNSLETLILAGNRLGDLQVLRFCQTLRNIGSLPSLANLDLSDNLLHVDSVKELALVLKQRNKKFWRLQLSGNSFNMKMLERLGILQQFISVCRNIDIRGLLTDQGLSDYVSEM